MPTNRDTEPLGRDEEVASSDAKAWESVVGTFEQAWFSGRQPTIEEFLTGAGADREQLLIELVHGDLEFRIRACDLIRVEAYFEKYPGIFRDAQRRFELVRTEVKVRTSLDEHLTITEYQKRFPDLADRLLELWGVGVPPAPSPRPMQLNCPHCRNPIEVLIDDDENVICPSCGSTFRLDHDLTRSWSRTLPKLGKFDLLSKIGTGAFGTVYKAYDSELKRHVALKIPRSGTIVDRDDESRFLREARSSAQLHHPGIVPVYEVGRSGQFTYIVSEFVDGVTLADASTASKFGFRESVELVIQIADALHYSHTHGVVHRDLKPSNIMLATTGQLRIMDFGLAKRDAGEITMTIEGQVLGTPAYMSPEQASGLAHQVDGRSDIYSLGVILFELLTSELPFRGNQRMLLHQVLHVEPRAPRSLNDRIPRDLDTICLKAIAKDPRCRYDSAGALADDLRRWLSHEPILARPVGHVERSWRWCRRNPLLSTASTIAVAALITSFLLLLSFAIVQSRSAQRLRGEQQKTSKALDQSQEQRRIADTRLSESYLNRGLMLCNQHDVAHGLLWLARGLETAPQDAANVRRRIRMNIASWSRDIHRLKQIIPHDGAVIAVDFSPDGTLLASGCHDTARVWNVGTGELTCKPLIHGDVIHALDFSPDGSLIATGSGDGTAVVWRVEDGEPRGSPLRHPAAVLAVAFSPAGEEIVTGCADGLARLWSVRRACTIGKPLEHPSAVSAVAFSPDGSLVASGTADGGSRLWNAEEGTLLGHVLKQQFFELTSADEVRGLAFSPLGDSLLTACGYNAQLWGVPDGRLISTAYAHRSFLRAVAFAPDGNTIATASVDNSARLWDTRKGQAIGVVLQHEHPVWTVAFCRDGRTIATGSGNEVGHQGELRVWEFAPEKTPTFTLKHPSSVWAVDYSPDGKTILTGCADKKARLWEVHSSESSPTTLPHPGLVLSAVYSPDGTTLATGTVHDTVRLWDAATHLLESDLSSQSDERDPPGKRELPDDRGVWALAFSPDSKKLIIGQWPNQACVWDITARPRIDHIFRHGSQVNAAAYSPRGREIATASEYDMLVRLWDAETGNLIGTPMLHRNVVKDVAFSPDGRTLATACWNDYAQLWDVASCRPKGPQLRHGGPVWAVEFSPTGSMLATGSCDNTAQLWDVESGAPLCRPFRHPSDVLDVAFRSNGKALLTGSHELDSSAREWAIDDPFEDNGELATLWLQVQTGMELDLGGELRGLEPSQWQECVNRLAAQPTSVRQDAQGEVTPTQDEKPVVPGASAPTVSLDKDDVFITESTQVRPATYRLVDANNTGIIRIKGDNLVIDGQGAILVGSAVGQLPNDFQGFGVIIEDSEGVTLRNFTIRGFKVGILAKNCTRLVIEGCDVSENWRMRLASTPDAEDPMDWLYGHENDSDEWLRYGAGLYVDRCQNVCVREVECHRGQNGICISRSHDAKVYDNDVSFNSGWGIALYRSRAIVVSHNKCDWCIRGYSHGVYNRGQDSAGILVYEQCSDNTFAFNSATHCGDGFFLFAGNDTLETGQGGCNRNLVYRNDFSHASNNGIEATFSSENRFVENTMDQADHAVWAGYSYDSVLVGNHVSRCNHGISIEHGNGNWIEGNVIEECGVAVNLWANEASDIARGSFGKEHSCLSEKCTIARNHLRRNKVQCRLKNTDKVAIVDNEIVGSEIAVDLIGRCHGVEVNGNNIEGPCNRSADSKVEFGRNYWLKVADRAGEASEQPSTIDFEKIGKKEQAPQVLGSLDTHLPENMPRGLEYIIVDEWGPYDFREPRIAPAEVLAWNETSVQVLGAGGEFTVEDIKGSVRVDPLRGTMPARVRVASSEPKSTEFSFQVSVPGHDKKLPCRGLLLGANWEVKFFRWPAAGPKMPPANWEDVVSSPVVLQSRLSAIDFRWGMGGPNSVDVDHFATIAAGELDLPPGEWQVSTVSDDGIRVYIDDQLAIDNWTWHGPTRDVAAAPIQGGNHTVRIEHFEIDGWAQLQLLVRRAKPAQ